MLTIVLLLAPQWLIQWLESHLRLESGLIVAVAAAAPPAPEQQLRIRNSAAALAVEHTAAAALAVEHTAVAALAVEHTAAAALAVEHTAAAAAAASPAGHTGQIAAASSVVNVCRSKQVHRKRRASS